MWSSIHCIAMLLVRQFPNFVSFRTTLFVQPFLICVFKKFSSMFDTETEKEIEIEIETDGDRDRDRDRQRQK